MRPGSQYSQRTNQSVPSSRRHQLCKKLLNQIQSISHQCQNVYEQQRYYNNDEPIHDEVLQQVSQTLRTTQEKTAKVLSLNRRLQADEQKLKLEYIMLLKEKHTYVNKLKAIQNLAQNFDWDDQGGTLRKIKPLIEISKDRLKESRTGGGTQK